jgi:hypothetical protein
MIRLEERLLFITHFKRVYHISEKEQDHDKNQKSDKNFYHRRS